MANTDAPNGFKPVRHLNGNPWNGQVEEYEIAASYGTALYVGDLVTLAGSASSDGRRPTVAVAAVGTNILGAIVGFKPLPTDLSKNYWAASDAVARTVYVCCDPSVIYQAQEDSDANDMAAVDVGLNVDFIANSGDATRQLSGHEIDESTKSTLAATGLHLLRIADIPGNAIGSYAVWEVLINEHHFGATIKGV